MGQSQIRQATGGCSLSNDQPGGGACELFGAASMFGPRVVVRHEVLKAQSRSRSERSPSSLISAKSVDTTFEQDQSRWCAI